MLTLSRLALRGSIYYWRTNVATALGIATAVGVLAGAWAVGDSVRETLRQLALGGLGRTVYALVSDGFFREALAPGAPLIALEGVVTHDASGRRASKVAVYAVDQRFWEFHQKAVHAPDGGQALVNPDLARALQANPGDTVLVRMPRASAMPIDSLHGRRDDPGRTMRMVVREVVTDAAMGNFSLRPVQGNRPAVFVPLARIQKEFDLGRRVNTALLLERPDIRKAYELEDLGLRRSGRMLTHESMVFSDDLVAAVRFADPKAEPVYTYLANTIRVGDRSIPYSLVAAMDRPEVPDEQTIALNDWAASELRAKPGDAVAIEFYRWNASGRLETETGNFKAGPVVPLDPTDRDLAPEYPGISNVESISDWDPPFPLLLERIRPADEKYWDQYRATPKAYIRLAAGQRLWRTRYGAVTGIRVSDAFDARKLRDRVDPEKHGLMVLPVRAEAEQSARGSTDFREYFIYFSFFLIVSGLLLAGLFLRFGLEQRAGEIATLRAVGFGPAPLRRLFLLEGLLVSAAGAVLGVIAAAAYAAAILKWQESFGASLHLSLTAVLLAAVTALLVGPAVVLLSLRSTKPRRLPVPHPLYPAVVGLGLLYAGGPLGFFGAGFLLLVAALLYLRRHLERMASVRTVVSLGLRYNAHRPGRAVLCIALIAAATFLIVAVDAFRRDGSRGEPGYTYFAEAAIPIYNDPQTLEKLPRAKWVAFRLRPGDDTGCTNLFAPQTPRILGVPASYMQLEPGTAAVDATTLKYVLHKKPGDLVEGFRIARVLHDSVFQSEILVSEPDFLRRFPDEGGFRVFLIAAPKGLEAEFESALADHGFDVMTTAERIASYHAVENAYLTTFQSLGALGLLLGTVGLGAVILRNVLERRRELGLLRAVGFGPRHLVTMTLAETSFLLLAGLASGTCAALVAVVPTVAERGGTPPYGAIALLLGAVFAAGLLVSLAAVRFITRAPLLDALRSD